jgi:hypothetical protein
MTVNERLRHVTLKVERAKKHVDELDRELRTFLDSNPYRVGVKRYPETRELIYYVSAVDATPESLALITGDIIQNLMSALDHLAYQIVCSDTGDNPPNPNWIYFPIADDAAKYEAKKRGKIEGARQETFDAIDALKPYKGGNNALWALYRLNNIEKHRLLFTVGSQAAGVNLGHLMADLFTSTVLETEPAAREMAEAMKTVDGANITDLFVLPSDSGFPLKEGFELFITGPEAEPNPNQQFRFVVALNEPGIAEGEPLLEAVHQLVTLVEGIVVALTPRLR